MVPTSICFQIPLLHTHIHIFTRALPILFHILFVWNKQTEKKNSAWWIFPETCLNRPPSVWLSASFTPAIFSHFANLPTRWQGAGKLLKVLWLQMSGPDVLLFLEWSCHFIFICFQLFAPIQSFTLPWRSSPCLKLIQATAN